MVCDYGVRADVEELKCTRGTVQEEQSKKFGKEELRLEKMEFRD